MNRYRAAVAVTAPALLTASLAAPARAADDPCLDPAALRVHGQLPDLDPVTVPVMPYMYPRYIDRISWPVITYDRAANGAVGLYVDDPACTGVTVTIRPPAGTGPDQRVPLNSYVEDFHGHFGSMTARTEEGGQWHFTEMQRGTTTLTLSPPQPFVV